MMITFLFLSVCVGLIHSAYLDGSKDYGKIKWEKTTGFNLKTQVPSGLQHAGGKPSMTYLSRVKKDGVYYCGRYHPTWKRTYITVDKAEVGVKQSEMESEILSFPRGTISWIFMMSGDPLPANAMECGQGPDGEPMTYACRGVFQKQIGTGRYMPSTKKCVIAYQGAQILDRFEIMTTNMLAKMTKVV